MSLKLNKETLRIISGEAVVGGGRGDVYYSSMVPVEDPKGLCAMCATVEFNTCQ